MTARGERVATAVAGLAAAAGLASATVLAAGDATNTGTGIGRIVAFGATGLGLAVAVIGLLAGWASFGPLCAVLLGAGWVGATVREPAGLRLVLVAGASLVIAELLAWSAESHGARPPGTPASERLRRLASVSGAGVVAALVVLGSGQLRPSADLGLAVVGIGALVAVAAVVASLIRERDRPT